LKELNVNRSLIRTAALAAPLLFTVGAFAQTATGPTGSALPPAAPQNSTVGPMPHASSVAALPHAGTPLSETDQTFVKKAAQGGIAEVQLAQLAQQKAQSDQVKQFAQKMIDDHTPNNQQLVQLSATLDVTPPSEPNEMQQKMAARLGALSGAKFDRVYIHNQIHDHEMMLKMFQAEASSGENPQLKAFAEQTVPVIQQHLALAQQLRKAGV
jgi:putative membrane protein